MAGSVMALLVLLMSVLRILTQPSAEFNQPGPFLEALTFYLVIFYAFRLVFFVNKIATRRGLVAAMICFGTYLMIPLLEWVFPGGGNAETYPDAGNLLINWSTFYLLSGDLGVWQIVRIFVCSAVIFLLLRAYDISRKRAIATNILTYTSLVLFTHADLWQYLPYGETAASDFIMENHLLSFRPVAYNTLLLSLLLGFLRPSGGETYRKRSSLLWIAMFLGSTFFISLFMDQVTHFLPFLLLVFSVALNQLLIQARSPCEDTAIERTMILVLTFIICFSAVYCQVFSSLLLLLLFCTHSLPLNSRLYYGTPIAAALILPFIF